MDPKRLQGSSGKWTVHDLTELTRQWKRQKANNNYKRYLWVWDLNSLTKTRLWIIWKSEPGYMESVVHGFLSPNLEAFPNSPSARKMKYLACITWFPMHNTSRPSFFLFKQHLLILICLACPDPSLWPENYSKINGPERIMFFTLDF